MAKTGLTSVWEAPSRQTTGRADRQQQAGWQTAAAGLFLALACAVLLGTAVSGGWHSDDSAHLNFITQYSAWQYFSVPEVMLQQSYAHITPWNALFYDMGLPFFGLQPEGHYVHMLVVLWLVALATFVLLRQWLAWTPALAGALLFLAMPSTGTVARMLMTGHYAYGLLFSVLALLAFSRAARQNSLLWGAVAALAYALACLCKELYVPLVAVLLCWPEGSARARVRIAAPVLVVALIYGVWRLWLMRGTGGHSEAGEALNLHDVWLSLKYLRERAVGPDWAGWAVTGCALALVALGWAGRGADVSDSVTSHLQRWRWVLFVSAAGIVLVLPLTRLVLLGMLNTGSGRLLVLVGWTVAVALAFILPSAWRHARWPTALMLAGLVSTLAISESNTAQLITLSQEVKVPQNRLLASGQPGALVAYKYESTGYFHSMARAAARLQGGTERTVVQDDEEMVALGSEAGAQAWMYAPDCRCMRRLGADYATLVADFKDRMARGRGRGDDIKVRMSFQGPRHRKVLRWTIDGAPSEAMKVDFYMRDLGWRDFPVHGNFTFGIDATVNIEDAFQLRLSFKLPDGAIVRSPLLSFPLDRPSEVHWSGADPSVEMITGTSLP